MRENNWISVKERLPEKHSRVLVYGKNRYEEGLEPIVCTAKFYPEDKWNKQGFIHGSKEVVDVTYWMPLPEPPKESCTCKVEQAQSFCTKKCNNKP